MKRLLLAALVASMPATAQNLRMGVGAQITSADPHFHNISPNNAYASMVFDNLLETDSKARLIGSLAESWKPVGEDAWEFTLRRGVRFHNGSDFTAEDVAFTLQRLPNVPNSPSSFAAYSRPIQAIEIVDPLTIRFRTAAPHPLMPLDMTNVRILDRETHQNATTEEFNAGRAAIGTGPYRMMAYRSGDRIDLQRFDGHWRGRPAWQSVDYRMITNDAGRTAALLAGDIDIIDQVPTSDLERLRRDQRISISEIDSMRFIYFALDHMRDGPTPFITDHDGKPLDRNPLKDVRVRRALSLAIDRPAIVARVMEGAASATRQVMPEGGFAYVPELAATRADPDLAKKLLAEAGYPTGFRLTLHGPNDRYPNDARIAQAVGQMWTRIGIRTQVDVAPYASFIAKASRQEFSVFLVSWGSSTGEPMAGLRSIAATFDRARGTGSVNRGRYSNPEFDTLLATAARELDPAKREALVRQATRVVVEDAGIISTHLQKNIWAMRRGFAHDARVDERTRAQDVTPAR
jgi:peptide/nickel transport system substrate-binding protein